MNMNSRPSLQSVTIGSAILVVVVMVVGPFIWMHQHPESDWLVVLAQWVSAAFVLLAAILAWSQLADARANARFSAVMRLIDSANAQAVLEAEAVVVRRHAQGFFQSQA